MARRTVSRKWPHFPISRRVHLRQRAWAGLVLVLPALAACSSIGPGRLRYDELDYAQTLSDAGKQQTMFNLVRMRYADSPMFASVQQMVAGYTLQGTVQGGFQTFPSDAASSFGSLQGTAQYTDRPTFTFAPLTGGGSPRPIFGHFRRRIFSR